MLDEVREATAEALEASVHLADHLDRVAVRHGSEFPLSATMVVDWQDARRETHHAMLRMFEQLYDLTSRRLLRGFLLLLSEDPAGYSLRNMFRRAETLGALTSADRWMELGVIRNRLVHDYPVSAQIQADDANLAFDALPDLLAATRGLISCFEEDQLL